MLPDRIRTAVGMQITSVSHRHVIIHLEISNTVIFDQTIYHIHAVFAYFRISEVQKVSFVIDVALSVAADKPVIRQFVCQFTRHTHDLDLQPQSHYHASFFRVIAYCFQRVRETFRGFFPLTDAIPPEPFVIPAAVQTVVFTAHFCRFINNRLLFLFCRISHQTVHVVVKYNV